MPAGGEEEATLVWGSIIMGLYYRALLWDSSIMVLYYGTPLGLYCGGFIMKGLYYQTLLSLELSYYGTLLWGPEKMLCLDNQLSHIMVNLQSALGSGQLSHYTVSTLGLIGEL